ncbi:Hpt domain-containing protein, partial [Desulfococcus sp.]|uniref:Hpt domain-containing protein n=1 Tax=Desulfococcus sp. TaxID=2025834 RepID=UPI00359338C4
HAPPGDPVIEEMPGISVAGGLARVGGNEALYRSLLKKFYQENKAIAARIKDALKDRDRQSARRMLHTLKGVAGNIGAAALYEAGAALESALDGADPAETAERLSRFESALGTVICTLETAAALTGPEGDGAPPDGMPLAAGDMAALRGLLLEMRPHLLKGKPIPLKRIMAEINTRTWPDAVNSGVATIGRLVDKYRFREAAAVVERLLASAEAESSR